MDWLGKVGGLVGQGGWAGWARWVGWLGKVGGLAGQGGWAGCWFLCSFQSEHLQCSDNCVVRLEVVSQAAGYGLIAGPSQFLIDVAVLIFEYVTLLWNVDHGYAAFLLYFLCHYFYYPVCKPPPSSALALTALVTRYFWLKI